MLKANYFFSKKILFHKKINTIKNKWLKNYLLSFCTIRNITIKILTIFINTLISCLLFFLLREWALNHYDPNIVSFNSGVAFSFASNWKPELVYFIKIFPTIIFFLLFLISNNWYIYIFSYILFLNSLLNIIDKAMIDNYLFNGMIYSRIDSVVDYIPFHAFNFVCNIADIFICTNFVFLIIGFVVKIIKEFKSQKEKENEDCSK